MQNSQVFFDKVLQTLVKVRNNGCFRDFRAIDPKAFLFFLFTYRGELSGFMQNSQVFFVEFGKQWVKVRNNGCFRDLRAIGWAETGFFPKYLVTDSNNRKKPGFFGLDASMTIGFKGDRPYSLKDVATLAMMTEFYRHLRSQPIKAEALRKAQLAMIHKQIVVKEAPLRETQGAIDLTQSAQVANSDLSHPMYWAGFTIIGSPW